MIRTTPTQADRDATIAGIADALATSALVRYTAEIDDEGLNGLTWDAEQVKLRDAIGQRLLALDTRLRANRLPADDVAHAFR